MPPSQENAATTSHVAQVTPTDEEEVTLPVAQVPYGSVIPPPPQDPFQLQLLLMCKPPMLCPEHTLSHSVLSLF